MIRVLLALFLLCTLTTVEAGGPKIKGARVSAGGGLGQIIVTFAAPLTLADNTAAVGGTGNTIHWGNVSQLGRLPTSYANSASVAFGTLTYTITGLASSIWYVCTTSTTATGESECDYEQSIVIP
jgi:hypothetical protein